MDAGRGPRIPRSTYNLFEGYVHDELTDEEYKTRFDDPEIAERFACIDRHFTEGLANGNAEFDEYQRNWWAYVLRFGHDWNKQCMAMDEVLYGVAEKIKKFAVIYLVDIDEVPDFNTMYELYDECTTMFFYRNKHIMVDLGTGNNNKVSWAMNNKQEFIDLVTTVFLGAKKGRGLVISPKDYSTKYRY